MLNNTGKEENDGTSCPSGVIERIGAFMDFDTHDGETYIAQGGNLGETGIILELAAGTDKKHQ